MLATLSPPTPAQAQSVPAPTLPGGASSIQETYQDWQVVCAIVNDAKRCAMSQQQVRQDSNQVLLTAEFYAAAQEETVSGTLVLPFGLQLASGVTLQIDDAATIPPLVFSTCLPAGCLVPFTLDGQTVAAARAGKTLNLQAASITGQPVALPVSLAGFSKAQDRLNELSKP
ncbi:invasion associated locus B family protein [Devosia sp.]|uniref:invasion associated locus B family protein n=1 Tax=Devosia sp. TaxID=1871048 RepID=UPI001AC7A7AD|nr:invasion associated locus B family protein [Devosia sp.]MBN9333197.1 invasion associated locus B family protein [Devosia sp.]